MFLSISKKAVTEADSLHVLEQAYSLTRPFGVPTLILDSEQLHFRDDLTEEYLNSTDENNMAFLYGSDHRLLSSIFFDALEKCPELSPDDALDIQIELCTATTARDFKKEIQGGLYEAHAHIMRNAQCKKEAHHYIGSPYSPPNFNTIFMAREHFSAHYWLASSLNARNDQVPNYLPGYDSQYHFMLLVHEMGHGTGADEAQTEMMAAITCRQIFANTQFISAWADIRALNLLYNMDECWQRHGYQWSMVDGLDHVITMDQSAVDVMNEDDIRALRFKAFPHADEQWKSLQMIFNAASHQTNAYFLDAYNKRNLPAIARIIRDSTTDLPDDTRIIAARIALAAERLSTPDAYNTKQPRLGPR